MANFRKLSSLAFRELGDNFTPFTFGQHSYCYHIAKKFNIELVFFGEISDQEYGGDFDEVKDETIPIEPSMIYWKGSNVYELIDYGIKIIQTFSRKMI